MSYNGWLKPFVPLIGQLCVEGKTAPEIAHILEDKHDIVWYRYKHVPWASGQPPYTRSCPYTDTIRALAGLISHIAKAEGFPLRKRILQGGCRVVITDLEMPRDYISS